MRSPKERKIFFQGDFDISKVTEASKKIIEIIDDDKDLAKECEGTGFQYTPEPIKLYINSYGGAVYPCLGLMSILLNSPTPIHTYAMGTVMSCGLLLSICGSKRFAYKDSNFLYHQISSGARGPLESMIEIIGEAKRLEKRVKKIILERTSITKKDMKKFDKAKKDWFFDADEALDLGVIHEII